MLCPPADSLGDEMFRGPRVRMGVHVAKQGTVAVKLHHLTRHKVFAGPAMTITQEVSEAANGGQIVLTEVSQTAQATCTQCTIIVSILCTLKHSYALKRYGSAALGAKAKVLQTQDLITCTRCTF